MLNSRLPYFDVVGQGTDILSHSYIHFLYPAASIAIDCLTTPRLLTSSTVPVVEPAESNPEAATAKYEAAQSDAKYPDIGGKSDSVITHCPFASFTRTVKFPCIGMNLTGIRLISLFLTGVFVLSAYSVSPSPQRH